MQENFNQFLQRLNTYSKLEIALELAVIWFVVYVVVRFLRGTGGAGIIKGLAFLLIAGTVLVGILGQGEQFQRLTYLFDSSLGFAAIGILVVFQPELRRALIRLGEASFFRASRSELAPMIEAIVETSEISSRNRVGVLIAIVRRVGLSGLIESGTMLNADVSAPLLRSIFHPKSALHDLGVVISGGKVVAAGVQFPLTRSLEIDQRYGSRHRAALGVTEESDCLAVIVSEETGDISVAERGELFRMRSIDDLRRFLVMRLLSASPDAAVEEVGTKVIARPPVLAAEREGFDDRVPNPEEKKKERKTDKATSGKSEQKAPT